MTITLNGTTLTNSGFGTVLTNFGQGYLTDAAAPTDEHHAYLINLLSAFRRLASICLNDVMGQLVPRSASFRNLNFVCRYRAGF